MIYLGRTFDFTKDGKMKTEKLIYLGRKNDLPRTETDLPRTENDLPRTEKLFTQDEKLIYLERKNDLPRTEK